jgi:cation transport ATPase
MRGQTHVYFDTAAAIVTLVLAGKLIERTAKDRASRSIALLYRLMPKKVRILSRAGERFVSIDALAPGQVFVVKAGERVPADGIVVEGETYADESLLSGEATPVAKRTGDVVVSGSLNAGGVIQVRATRTGNESALAQIIRLVERALASRAPIERTVDRVARVFVPVVVLLAALDFAVLAGMHAGIVAAMLRATTILVIACPCALGLATPLAITAAVGRASQEGLLISDSRVLETLGKIDVAVLDKTGTVTRGDFRLVEFALLESKVEALAMAAGGGGAEPLHAESNNEELLLAEWLPMLAGIEAYSEHLLGRAVVEYACAHHVQSLDAESVEICKGEGISGTAGGRRVFIGNRQMMSTACCEMDADVELRARELQKASRTVAFFGWDSWPTAAAVARQIGVDDFTAEATPAAKVRIIQELQQSGKRVVLIGDGVNDAPALAQADLGIALGTGADIAMSAAPVVLVSGSLARVEDAFRLAAKTTRVVRQNLFWAVAMLLSSTSVVANSMRLTRQEGR